MSRFEMPPLSTSLPPTPTSVREITQLQGLLAPAKTVTMDPGHFSDSRSDFHKWISVAVDTCRSRWDNSHLGAPVLDGVRSHDN